MQIENESGSEADTGTDGATDAGTEATTPEASTSTEPTTTADAVARALAGDDDGVEPEAEAPADGAEAADGKEGQGEGKPDKPADDEADLKTPEGLSAGSKERFEKLVDRVRTTTQERDQVAAERDQAREKFQSVVKVMEDTGAPPEQFAQTLVMLGMANSGDPEKVSQALDMIDQFRATLAKQTGRVVPGVDVLADFPDLREKVKAGDIEETDAAELAAARRDKASRELQAKEGQRKQDEQGQMTERVTKAQGDLTTLGNTLKAKDPDFKQKLDILGKRGFFDRVSKTAPPEQWGELFTIAYEALGDVAAARTPAPKGGNKPLHSTPDGGGGAPRPKTTADAVRLALAEE